MSKNTEYIVPVAIGLGALFFFRQIAQAFGLIKSADDVNAASLINANYFDPKFWKQGGAGAMILTDAGAKIYAKQLYNAKGLVNDDEAAVYDVFKRMKTKSQVSYLSDKFSLYYNTDLISYLQSFLNPEELLKVKTIVNPLPNFKV